MEVSVYDSFIDFPHVSPHISASFCSVSLRGNDTQTSAGGFKALKPSVLENGFRFDVSGAAEAICPQTLRLIQHAAGKKRIYCKLPACVSLGFKSSSHIIIQSNQPLHINTACWKLIHRRRITETIPQIYRKTSRKYSLLIFNMKGKASKNKHFLILSVQPGSPDVPEHTTVFLTSSLHAVNLLRIQKFLLWSFRNRCEALHQI